MNKQLHAACCAISLIFAVHANAEEAGTPLLNALKGTTINGYTAVVPSWQPENSAPIFIRNYHAPVRAYGGLSAPTPNYRPIRNYGGPNVRPVVAPTTPRPIPSIRPGTPVPTVPPRNPIPTPTIPGSSSSSGSWYGSSGSTTVLIGEPTRNDFPIIHLEPPISGDWPVLDVPGYGGEMSWNGRDLRGPNPPGLAPIAGDFQAVPEPSTWALLAFGGFAVGFAKFRRRK